MTLNKGPMTKLTDDEILLMKINKMLLNEEDNVYIYNNAFIKQLEHLRNQVNQRLKTRFNDVR